MSRTPFVLLAIACLGLACAPSAAGAGFGSSLVVADLRVAVPVQELRLTTCMGGSFIVD